MTASYDHVLSDATASVVSCPWRLVPGQLPEDPTQVRWWNRLTGQSREDSAGWGWLDAIHPDDQEAVHNAWLLATEGIDPYLAVFRVITSSNDTHLLLAYALPSREGAEPTEVWSGRIIDITLYERSTNYAAAVSELLSKLSEAPRSPDIPAIVREVVQRACNADAVAVLIPALESDAVAISASSDLLDLPVQSLLDSASSGPSHDGHATHVYRIHDDLFGFSTVIAAPIPAGTTQPGVVVVGFQEAFSASEVDGDFVQAVALHVGQSIRLNDSLRGREARFRHLAEALPQIVWVSSGDGSRLEYLNQRWEEYTGIDAGDVTPANVSLLTHPDDREQEHQRWRRSLQTGEPFEMEMRLQGSDGSYSWFLNRGVPVRNASGDIETWFGTITDIDVQRTALTHQSVISALDTQIRLLSDPAQILQTLVTTVGRQLQVDRCFLTEVLDVDQPNAHDVALAPAIAVRALWVAGDSDNIDSVRELAPILSRQFASDLRPGLVIAVNDLQNEAPTDEAKAIAAQLGVRAIIIVPYLRAGRWVAGITVHSMTPRKWTSAELAIVESAVKRTWPLVERSRAVEALSESENRLRHAAEAANFASFDFDPRSGEGYWSNDTYRVFRRRDLAAPPSTLEELVAMVDPDDQQRLRDLVASVSRPGASNVIMGEFRHRTDDDEICWFLLRGSVQFSGSEDERIAERIRGVLMDITPRKREEEERLVGLDAAVHDLKNPVATIRALAQVGMRMEQRSETPNEEVAELLKSIESATDRLTAVIGDFTDTAHLRAGRELPLQRKLTDLAVLLSERVEVSRESNPDREFIESSTEEPVEGCWDAARLRRVFDNLLGNAVKFSPDGGPIEITVRRERTPGGEENGVVEIVDRGIGIAVSDLARVQGTFERGSNVPESIPGTGMGLMAARLIAHQHGGSLDLASVEGEGTTVIIRLPIEPCGETER